MRHIYKEVLTAYSNWPKEELGVYRVVWRCFCYSSNFERLYAKRYKGCRTGRRTYVLFRNNPKKG